MQINIVNFGIIAEITRHSDLRLDDIADTDTLRRYLEASYPGLKNITYAIAVNKQVINKNVMLVDKDDIALLPPFSGG